MAGPEFIAEFTEDVGEARTCDKCSDILQPGDGHLIRSFRPGQSDRLVCIRCREYYKNKPTTVRVAGRPDILPDPTEVVRATFVLPDPKVIRATVSAAQAQASVNPPPVVAIANSTPYFGGHMLPASSMPPPPMRHAAAVPAYRPSSSHNHGKQGPDVHVPSVWSPRPSPSTSLHPRLAGPSISSAPIGLPHGSIGYNAQHLQYMGQQARWARAAQQGVPTAEIISLGITVVHEGGAKRRHPRSNTVGIFDGAKDVDAQSSAQQLAARVLNAMIPKIRAHEPQFSWRFNEFTVRDKKWVDLTSYPTTEPYFYNECLHPGKAKNSRALVFKTNHFPVYLVIPEKHWDEYEVFKSANVAAAAAASESPPRARHFNHAPQASAVVVASTSAAAAPGKASLPASSPPPPGIGKRNHCRTSSSSSISTRSPPLKHARPTFSSPDRNELRAALKAGGAMDFNIRQAKKTRIEIVDFHPIPTLDIEDLVGEKSAFKIETSEVFLGNLRRNLSSDAMLGVGAFKTAQSAQLTLTPLRSSGLGSLSNHPTVLKRFYVNILQGSYVRPGVAEESQKLYREANVLYWAKALLKMTYDYIDRSIEEADEDPPFEVPRLRFVEAGLVLAYEQANRNAGPLTGTKTGTLSAVYLAEEVIPTTGGTDGFVKFIHNSDAAPRIFVDPVAEEIAEFLSFTQHVQYAKTGGQVYISDYQGCPPLLTDPQILTHPDVGEGIDLFGDGNVEKGVELFEKEHECNKYCVWPGFGLHVFGGGLDSGVI